MATRSYRIGASNQDIRVYYTGAAWTADLTNIHDRVGRVDATHVQYGCGMIVTFTPAIRKNTVFSVATMTITCASADSANTANSKICAESNVNAGVFVDLADYQARRDSVAWGGDESAVTVEHVHWDAIGAWVLDTAYTSPDFSAVMNELAALGNLQRVAFFWDDHDNLSVGANARRIGYSWDLDPTKAPLFDFAYIEPPSGMGTILKARAGGIL